ncbi:MAG: hypothetical protein JHC52_11535 [Chthoniobacterales bacterium]|nr:hypothetical protein [Chthoniobacterales bacterium]
MPGLTYPLVVREAVGDRLPAPHEQSLIDLQAKYADVETVGDVVAKIGGFGQVTGGDNAGPIDSGPARPPTGEPAPWRDVPPADRRLALHGKVVYCSHLVKVEEPVAGYPVRIPVTPEVARRAMDLVRQFPGCFWFWKEEPSISFRDDVESVIRNLRQYGDKSAWSAAQELRQCL